MPDDRLTRILGLFEASGDTDVGPPRLCEVCAEAVGMTGAGVMLITGDKQRGSVCSSDEVSALIEDLQYTLGEGPCVDACREDRPVLEPHLAEPGVPRWPAFTGPVVASGARAVFCFPLQIGGARLGALHLYRDRPGSLSADQHADALVVAGMAARAVLAMQAGAPPGVLGAELEARSDLHFVVQQAAGMVSAQLDVSVADALIRLRANAFADDRPLTAVAEDVVARRVRFA